MSALWLYGLVPEGQAAPALSGVDPRGPVRAVPVGQGVAALVSEVDAGAFVGADAEARLADLAALQPLVMRHHAVVSAVGAAVVATRFATLFHDEGTLREGVAAQLGAVRERLEALEGCQEWSVKGWLDRDAAVGPPPGRQASGLAYMRAKQAHRDALAALVPHVDRWSDALAERLEPLTREATSRAVVPGDDPRGEMVWNWAFLIPEGEEGPFLAALEAAAPPDGVAVGVGGPLPPYSFGQVGEG